jgi:hypothetical protein
MQIAGQFLSAAHRTLEALAGVRRGGFELSTSPLSVVRWGVAKVLQGKTVSAN